MVALVTLEDVNFRLRLDLERAEDGEEEGEAGAFTDERVPGIQRLIEDATGIVLDYLKTDGAQWSLEAGEEEGEEAPGPVPATVTAAICLVVRNLYDEVDEPLSPAVRALLERHRDPALA